MDREACVPECHLNFSAESMERVMNGQRSIDEIQHHESKTCNEDDTRAALVYRDNE